MSRETDIFKKHCYNLCFQRAQRAETCTFECLAKYRVPIRSRGWSVAHSCGSAPRDAHLLHRSCPWFNSEQLPSPKQAECGEVPTSHLPFYSFWWHWLEIKLWNGLKTEQQKEWTSLPGELTLQIVWWFMFYTRETKLAKTATSWGRSHFRGTLLSF